MMWGRLLPTRTNWLSSKRVTSRTMAWIYGSVVCLFQMFGTFQFPSEHASDKRSAWLLDNVPSWTQGLPDPLAPNTDNQSGGSIDTFHTTMPGLYDANDPFGYGETSFQSVESNGNQQGLLLSPRYVLCVLELRSSRLTSR